MTEEAYLIIFRERDGPNEVLCVRATMYNITKPQLSNRAETTNLDQQVSKRALRSCKLLDLLRYKKAGMVHSLLNSQPPDRSEQDCTLLPVSELQKLKDELEETKRSLRLARNELAFMEGELISAEKDLGK